jgi:hypothetical protein
LARIDANGETSITRRGGEVPSRQVEPVYRIHEQAKTAICGYFIPISALADQSTGLCPTKSKIFCGLLSGQQTRERHTHIREKSVLLSKLLEVNFSMLIGFMWNQ